MAAFLDPVTKRRIPLHNDLVLGLLNNGDCSDLEIYEDDEEFVAQGASGDYEPPDVQQLEHYCSTSDGAEPVPRKKQNSLVKKAKTNSKNKVAKRKLKVKLPVRRRLWKKADYIDKPHNYPGHPVPNSVRSPTEYYNDYYNEEFYEMVAVCTNLYHMRQTGRVLNTSKTEIMRLYGAHLLMGILSFPRLAMYWRRNTSIKMITDAMTRDRFTLLRRCLHVVDTDRAPAKDAGNPLWKVQPVLDTVRKGCDKILRVPGRYSVDEPMIPFTGKCHMRQMVKNKPRPVGLKNFVITTSEGLMIDFEIYHGNNPALYHPLGLGPGVVLRLNERVPPGSCIFFYRYFTTIPLLEELEKQGYHGTGTIMANRVPNSKELKMTEDKKMKRGDIDQRVSDNVVLVKWKDSKAVLTASNWLYCYLSDFSNKKRFFIIIMPCLLLLAIVCSSTIFSMS